MARVNERAHSFTCHPHVYPNGMSQPAFTFQPQSITALWLVLSLSVCLCSLRLPVIIKVLSYLILSYLVLISRPAEDRRLSWPGWLGEILRWFVYPPKAVTRARTNRARRRVTSLIRATTLPLRLGGLASCM